MRKDLPGDVRIARALQQIRGIGASMAHAVLLKSGIQKDIKLGDLNEAQISGLAKILEALSKQGFPAWMLNHRKEYTTGLSTHFIEGELEFAQREDVQRMKRMRSYKGVRHMLGLRVRGQRTRSTGRKGTVMGVARKKPGAPAAPQPSAAKAAAKPAPTAPAKITAKEAKK